MKSVGLEFKIWVVDVSMYVENAAHAQQPFCCGQTFSTAFSAVLVHCNLKVPSITGYFLNKPHCQLHNYDLKVILMTMKLV